MLTVLRSLNRHRRDLAQHPFLAFLADGRKDPTDRLAFAPSLAPFVLGFSDVNVFGLRDTADETHWQALVNEHTREDDHHWPMYLDDLATLGHDKPTTVVNGVRDLWGVHTQNTRALTYGLMSHAKTCEPVLRIALIEAVETTGYVAWQAFQRTAADYERSTGRRLRYFGAEHAALETGHAMGADDIDRELASITLDREQRDRAVRMIDEVFSVVRRHVR